MSEWPQYATVKTRKKLRETIQVIPADLGRELYEGIQRQLSGAEHSGVADQLQDALARYEKEVGK